MGVTPPIMIEVPFERRSLEGRRVRRTRHRASFATEYASLGVRSSQPTLGSPVLSYAASA
jgi:hypothetical protein